MPAVNYRQIICLVVPLCILTLWFILLHKTTTKNHAPSSIPGGIKQLPYRILESKTTEKSHIDTLLDLGKFEYILNNASICSTSKSATVDHSTLVIMIHSARDHFDQRYAIRNTWGSVKTYRQWRLHLVFLLGIDATSDPKGITENRLWDESNQFGDMVMGNFVDSYRNLTYKHLMGYKWVNTFCPAAKYILKTDDDMYANIFQVIDVLLVQLINSGKSFGCLNMIGNNPIRNQKNKWYVSETEYLENKYPPFCSGTAYIVRVEDASKIYFISNKTIFFWVDDVFVTGILREKYDALANTGSSNSMQILSFNSAYHFHFGDKKPIMEWCAKDSITQHLIYFFVNLKPQDFIRDMFCIWNKVKLTRFAMNLALNPTMYDKEMNLALDPTMYDVKIKNIKS